MQTRGGCGFQQRGSGRGGRRGGGNRTRHYPERCDFDFNQGFQGFAHSGLNQNFGGGLFVNDGSGLRGGFGRHRFGPGGSGMRGFGHSSFCRCSFGSQPRGGPHHNLFGHRGLGYRGFSCTRGGFGRGGQSCWEFSHHDAPLGGFNDEEEGQDEDEPRNDHPFRVFGFGGSGMNHFNPGWERFEHINRSHHHQ